MRLDRKTLNKKCLSSWYFTATSIRIKSNRTYSKVVLFWFGNDQKYNNCYKLGLKIIKSFYY